MGIRHEINAAVKGMRKQAQVWGYYAPAHDPQAEANIAKKIPNMAWGALGVGSGLAKGVWDRTFGDGSQGDWKDYLKAGWNAGFNHGDMVAAGMIEGAANSIPFVEQKKIPGFVDFVHKEKIDAGMEPEAADALREGGNYAGMLAAQLPIWKLFGLAGKGVDALGGMAGKATGIVVPMAGKAIAKGVSALGNMAGKATGKVSTMAGKAIAKGVGSLGNMAGKATGKFSPMAGKAIAKGAPLAFWGKALGWDDDISAAYHHLTADSDLEFLHERIEALSRMNPESPEYADQYEVLKDWSKKDPKAFARLREPVRPGPWRTNADASY